MELRIRADASDIIVPKCFARAGAGYVDKPARSGAAVKADAVGIGFYAFIYLFFPSLRPSWKPNPDWLCCR